MVGPWTSSEDGRFHSRKVGELLIFVSRTPKSKQLFPELQTKWFMTAHGTPFNQVQLASLDVHDAFAESMRVVQRWCAKHAGLIATVLS